MTIANWAVRRAVAIVAMTIFVAALFPTEASAQECWDGGWGGDRGAVCAKARAAESEYLPANGPPGPHSGELNSDRVNWLIQTSGLPKEVKPEFTEWLNLIRRNCINNGGTFRGSYPNVPDKTHLNDDSKIDFILNPIDWTACAPATAFGRGITANLNAYAPHFLMSDGNSYKLVSTNSTAFTFKHVRARTRYAITFARNYKGDNSWLGDPAIFSAYSGKNGVFKQVCKDTVVDNTSELEFYRKSCIRTIDKIDGFPNKNSALLSSKYNNKGNAILCSTSHSGLRAPDQYYRVNLIDCRNKISVYRAMLAMDAQISEIRKHEELTDLSSCNDFRSLNNDRFAQISTILSTRESLLQGCAENLGRAFYIFSLSNLDLSPPNKK